LTGFHLPSDKGHFASLANDDSFWYENTPDFSGVSAGLVFIRTDQIIIKFILLNTLDSEEFIEMIGKTVGVGWVIPPFLEAIRSRATRPWPAAVLA
jgi:hypothetical protein